MVVQAERSEATIARILSAAEGLFLGRPYADVTMDGIAERARVTKGALYHHFRSKEVLYMAMMAEDLRRKREIFEEAASAEEGCRSRLRALTASYLRLPREKRDLIHLVRRDANVFREPHRSRLVRSYQASLPQAVQRIVEDGIRSGELGPADPRLLSWHFIAVVEVTLNRYADGLFRTEEERLAHVLDLFFLGARRKEAR